MGAISYMVSILFISNDSLILDCGFISLSPHLEYVLVKMIRDQISCSSNITGMALYISWWSYKICYVVQYQSSCRHCFAAQFHEQVVRDSILRSGAAGQYFSAVCCGAVRVLRGSISWEGVAGRCCQMWYFSLHWRFQTSVDGRLFSGWWLMIKMHRLDGAQQSVVLNTSVKKFTEKPLSQELRQWPFNQCRTKTYKSIGEAARQHFYEIR